MWSIVSGEGPDAPGTLKRCSGPVVPSRPRLRGGPVRVTASDGAPAPVPRGKGLGRRGGRRPRTPLRVHSSFAGARPSGEGPGTPVSTPTAGLSGRLFQTQTGLGSLDRRPTASLAHPPGACERL